MSDDKAKTKEQRELEKTAALMDKLRYRAEAAERRLGMKIVSNVLSARPGDVIVLRVEEELDDFDIEAVTNVLRHAGLQNTHLLVLPTWATISVLSDEQKVALKEALA